MEYTIKIENFEGPLDLLFHLIEKNKFNIYDIPINEITDQYMDYLYNMEHFNMDVAGEFLVMAATLLHIKSRMMLPLEKKDNEEDGEGDDPRDELVMRLMEYKVHKEFSGELRNRFEEWKGALYKYPEGNHRKAINNGDMDADMLVESILYMIRSYNEKEDKSRLEKMDVIVKREKVSLRLKIKQIITELKKKSRFKFRDMFAKSESGVSEVVVGFIAILELARNRKVRIRQKKIFGDILVERMDEKNG